MVASYLLASTFVPVLTTWVLRGHQEEETKSDAARLASFARFQNSYRQVIQKTLPVRWFLVGGYLVMAALVIVFLGKRLGAEIFPGVDTGQLQVRLRAPAGTEINGTEADALQALDIIKQEVGPDNLAITLGFIGVHGSPYPINFIYLWNGGPQEGVIQVQLKPGTPVRIEELKERLRSRFARQLPGVSFSFEPGDIISRVMSLGSDTPIEVAVSGLNPAASREFAEKVRAKLQEIPALRDVQIGQSLDYPTVDLAVDRQRAGLMGVKMADVSRSLVAATSSSRFVVPNYWADPNSGVAYQMQVEIPQTQMNSIEAVKNIPILERQGQSVLLRNIAEVKQSAETGEYERYNMQRMITVTANIAGADLGSVGRQVASAIRGLGSPPAGTTVVVRGQGVPLQQMMAGLRTGLLLAVAVIFLLLAANFQSVELSATVVSTAPAVVTGVVLALWLTGTTLNIQSFMGAIMAVGVAVANAILLVTFAERHRLGGAAATEAAVEGAASRLRPILMTSLAMMAGMLPMALGLGEGGQQTAPLGRAVIGGLAAATVATLVVLPSVFAIIRGHAGRRSASLDPDDPSSSHFGSLKP
jgi:multidrug efflux pump subunit AcrB